MGNVARNTIREIVYVLSFVEIKLSNPRIILAHAFKMEMEDYIAQVFKMEIRAYYKMPHFDPACFSPECLFF